MSPHRRLLVAALAVALVQIGFLSSMIAGRASILRNGQEVVLEVLPVDPRDLLRGDYVMLGYNISSVQRSLFSVQPETAEGWGEREVFVRLRPGDNGIWVPVAARFAEDAGAPPQEGDVEIRGTTTEVWGEDTTVRVAYGIERFYLPEGQGRPIEADLRERSFRMRVAVAADGAPQIKAFFDGEAKLFEEPLY